MEDWKAKQAAKAAAAEALRAAFPYLVPANGKGGALIAASKNLRIELSRAFPGVKFSVKTSRYSGGDSMNVRWIDGPTAKQVDEIADRYQGKDFDGMDDSTHYRVSAWQDAFGEAGYVFCNRDDSDKAVASAIRTLCAKYAANFSSLSLSYNYDDLQSLIGRESSKRTWSLSREPIAKAPAPTFEEVSAIVVANATQGSASIVALVERAAKAANGEWLQ